VFDHHDLTPELFLSRFEGRHRWLHRATLVLERATFGAADVVLATNESYRTVACGRGRRDPSEVFVVRNGPDLRRFEPVAPDPGLRRGRPLLIGYVGMMAPQDGVDHGLRALARLRCRRDDWHAVFAGDGDARSQMMQLSSELGLSDRVDFVGWLDSAQVASLLCTCDVCLAPEPSTPLNEVSTMIKIAEYMAMSRPIVAYRLPETCMTAQDAAVYAAPNDVGSFAACIDELLSDPARRAAMGRIGRARVERELSWEHSELALAAAYDSVLSEARAVRSGRVRRI
jgi:glycosyltransferase involved in cell wall biosynthesis